MLEIVRPGHRRLDIYFESCRELSRWGSAFWAWKSKRAMSWVYRQGAWPPKPRHGIFPAGGRGQGNSKGSLEHKLKFGTWNINGIRRKLSAVTDLVNKQRLHLAAIQETHLSIRETLLEGGFKVFSSPAPRSRNNKWGVALLVREDLAPFCSLLGARSGREV